MSSKKPGSAANMGQWGPDESTQKHVNTPLRDIDKGGHHLNESYKCPVAACSEDVKARGNNASYHHPLVKPEKENSPAAQVRGNRVAPVNQFGKGK